MDVDAAIGKHTGITVNPADAGCGGNNALQPFRRNSTRHPFVSFSRARVDEMLLRRW
jgi:hypothetical protein